MKKYLIIIILLIVSCTDNTDEDMRLMYQSLPSNEVLPANAVRVFIYTGQSNCPGRGLNTDATVGELASQPQMKIWSKINSQFEDLDIGTNNLNSTIDSHGIELGLASNFNTYFLGETGYLIKWGVASTEIVKHLSGGVVYTELFDNYVKPAINDLINSGKIPYIYFIYAQGERDANTNLPSPAGEYLLYADRFDTWISLWQSNFSTDLPIANYELLEPGPSGYEMAHINADFASKSLTEPNYQVMETSGKTDIGDDLHYDYQAQKEISVLALSYFKNNLGHKQTTLIP